MKRFLAMLLAVVMTLGMATTVFAATNTSATITVKEADDTLTNASLSYVQVIKPLETSKTGWTFTSDAIAADFKAALGVEDDQMAIAMLIKAQNAELPELAPSIVKTATAASAVQIQQAFDNVINDANVTFATMANPQTVTEAGLYAVKATEVGYTYKAMAAYVGFDTVTIEGTTYAYPALDNATLTVKKIPTTITKADNDENNAVAIGQVVTYTVTTYFPYFNQNDVNKEFKITDAITGAEYKDLGQATVTIGGGDPVVATFALNDEKNGFTVDLSTYVDNANSNAGKKVVVTYQAVVKGVEVENKAASHIAGVIVNSNPVKLYTGKITLTKEDAENKEVKLAGAGFQVKSGDAVLTFTQKDPAKKVYTYDPNGTTKEVFTDAEGNVVVEGLDIGTYVFEEKTAPEGYSINETPATIELDITDENEANNDGEAVAIFADAGSIADTKLLALPGTGGVGTTIFTVGGCAVMIGAAFLFFMNRRKEESK